MGESTRAGGLGAPSTLGSEIGAEARGPVPRATAVRTSDEERRLDGSAGLKSYSSKPISSNSGVGSSGAPVIEVGAGPAPGTGVGSTNGGGE
jgi:hypothetical protein